MAQSINIYHTPKIQTGDFQITLTCRRDEESGEPQTLVNPTYTVEYNYGKYKRVDNICFITFHIKAEITNRGQGYSSLGNLPFTSLSGAGGQALAMQEMGGAIITSLPGLTCTIPDGTTQVNLEQNNGLSAFTWDTGIVWIGFSGSYFINENP